MTIIKGWCSVHGERAFDDICLKCMGEAEEEYNRELTEAIMIRSKAGREKYGGTPIPGTASSLPVEKPFEPTIGRFAKRIKENDRL